MIVDEIFCSIQGEGTDAGTPCIFVRLYGCNVHCAFCDQPQDPSKKKRMSLDRVINKITECLPVKSVCITGGEPLIQSEDVYVLLYELVSMGYRVSIETNGCVPIDADDYNRKHKYVMDIKCPSSGVSDRNIYNNLDNLHAIDEVKFVIGNREDYDFAKIVMRKYPTKAKILFSPIFKDGRPVAEVQELGKWLIKDRLLHVRIQIQMHKILGVQ